MEIKKIKGSRFRFVKKSENTVGNIFIALALVVFFVYVGWTVWYMISGGGALYWVGRSFMAGVLLSIFILIASFFKS